MKDVTIFQNKASLNTLCIISDLSDELKSLIRKRLASICHGAAKGNSGAKQYSYKKTLKEFLERYDSKTTKQKKGMIGELLIHMLIPNCLKIFKAASPFFNLEEDSMKKGFDIILFNTLNKSLYITEVKSGHAKNDPSNVKNKSLLETARRDLKTRLSSNNKTLWHNAINGVTIALENDTKLKKIIKKILEECLDNAQEDNSDASSKNVVLCSVLYCNLKDQIVLDNLECFKESLDKKQLFKQSIIFSIQKATFGKVEKFLKGELVNGKS